MEYLKFDSLNLIVATIITSTFDIIVSTLLFLGYHGFKCSLAFSEEFEKSWRCFLLDLFICSCIRFLAMLIHLFHRRRWTKSFVISVLLLSLIYNIVKAICFGDWHQHDAAALIICSFCFIIVRLIIIGLDELNTPQIQKGYPSINSNSALNEHLLSEEEKEVENIGGATEKNETSSAKKIDLKRLFGLAKPEQMLLCVATVALFLSALSTMAIPHFIGILIDKVADDNSKKELDQNCLYLLGIFIAGSIFTFIRGTIFNIAGERLVCRLRTELYKRIIIQEAAFFDEQKTGDLMNRLAADTTVVQNSVTVNISMGLRSLAQVVLSTALLFVTSWKLSVVMMAVVPLLIAFARLYGGYARRLSKDYQDALAKASEVAQEALSNNRTVKSFSAERYELNRYSEKVGKSYKLGVKKSFAYGIFISVISLLSYCAMLTVLWYGGRLVMTGDVSTGDLTAFLLYTVYIATGLGTLSGLFSDFMSALGASERVFNLIDRTPAIPYEGGVQSRTIQGHIVFEDVKFVYPTRLDTPVLSGLSFDIQPNQTVALVGQSGAGKSTVLALLERFYDPISGRILLDGVEIKTLDPSWLRSHVAMVQQEPVLFSGTILDNITYGISSCQARASHPSQGPSDSEGHENLDKIEKVARLANCHDFITRFPDGYKTLVGERGVRLSGGQKQRIAIARALLMNPKVLLLDEATSALDAESEHLVQQAIDRLMTERTVMVIAHRLSTVQHADKIIVMTEGGKIVSQGRHSELLNNCTIYKQLVRRQLHEWSESKS